MRKLKNVEANLAARDAGGLDADRVQRLRPHRWDRRPTRWSQVMVSPAEGAERKR